MYESEPTIVFSDMNLTMLAQPTNRTPNLELGGPFH